MILGSLDNLAAEIEGILRNFSVKGGVLCNFQVESRGTRQSLDE